MVGVSLGHQEYGLGCYIGGMIGISETESEREEVKYTGYNMGDIGEAQAWVGTNLVVHD